MNENQPLVLLPGLHGSIRLFDLLVKQLRQIAPRLNVLPLPLPSSGPQDYPTLAGPFIERLASLGPVSLLAESFSGPLALHIAASPRVRVEHLVLTATFCGAPQPAVFSLVPLRPLFAFRPPKQVIRRFLAGPNATDAIVDAIRTEAQAARGKMLARRLRVIFDLHPDRCPLPKDCKTLILQAQHDALLPWEAQSELERRMPDAQVAWIDGPHLLLQTRPADCAQRIMAFLEQ
jgi:pimeloyl-[acyl-carrier protein] methyl ester esterase